MTHVFDPTHRFQQQKGDATKQWLYKLYVSPIKTQMFIEHEFITMRNGPFRVSASSLEIQLLIHSLVAPLTTCDLTCDRWSLSPVPPSPEEASPTRTSCSSCSDKQRISTWLADPPGISSKSFSSQPETPATHVIHTELNWLMAQFRVEIAILWMCFCCSKFALAMTLLGTFRKNWALLAASAYGPRWLDHIRSNQT